MTLDEMIIYYSQTPQRVLKKEMTRQSTDEVVKYLKELKNIRDILKLVNKYDIKKIRTELDEVSSILAELYGGKKQ